VESTGSSLIVTIRGVERVLSLRSHLEIPLEHVVGAERDAEEATRWWHGVRGSGTHVPGLFAAGTFHEHGERIFWDVRHPENAIAIRLRGERFSRLVVDVDDPDETVSLIRAALAPPPDPR